MDRTFVCSDGFKLAWQQYSPAASSSVKDNRKVLLLHGWLDNCRSFWKLAPALASASLDVVAVDLPGHGLSDHRPPNAPSILLNEAVYYVAEVLQQFLAKDEKVILIGHSMGASISLAYAATFPDQVDRLVLLESLGPISKPDQDVTQHLRRHVEKRIKGNVSLYGENAKGPRAHASRESAIETRMKTATDLAPGKQYISQQAATELVDRATVQPNRKDEEVQFTHDYRLYWPSLMYTTPGQMIALQEAVECPTCLLLAQDGWPMDEDRLETGKKHLNPDQFAVLPGSHHFHADPDTCEAVTDDILKFLVEE